MGFDIQNYYTLQQSLTLEDLAKAGSKHTLKGLVKVINKVIFQRAKLQKKNKSATMFLLRANFAHFANAFFKLTSDLIFYQRRSIVYSI